MQQCSMFRAVCLERKCSHISCAFGNVESTTDKAFDGFDTAPFSFSLSLSLSEHDSSSIIILHGMCMYMYMYMHVGTII